MLQEQTGTPRQIPTRRASGCVWGSFFRYFFARRIFDFDWLGKHTDGALRTDAMEVVNVFYVPCLCLCVCLWLSVCWVARRFRPVARSAALALLCALRSALCLSLCLALSLCAPASALTTHRKSNAGQTRRQDTRSTREREDAPSSRQRGGRRSPTPSARASVAHVAWIALPPPVCPAVSVSFPRSLMSSPSATLYYTPTSCGAASFLAQAIAGLHLKTEEVSSQSHRQTVGQRAGQTVGQRDACAPQHL
jgi:hypothetical protein